MASAPAYQPSFPYANSRSIESQLPRVPVPPIDYDYTSGKPMMDLTTTQSNLVMYQDDKYGDTAFLRCLLATKPANLDVQLLDWNFDMRRQAQAILPFLYLGPSSSMRDATFLDGAGITFLLAVRSSNAAQGRPNYLNPATSPAAINRQTATFDIETPYDFLGGIKPILKTIVDYLQANSTLLESSVDIQARILVCCETGNDRSATFVAAVLMVIYGFSAAEAMQVVISQRCSVAIDENMRRGLLTFENILAAERQVASAQLAGQAPLPSLQTAQTSQNKKRNHSTFDMDDDDKMQDSEDSLGDGEERSGVAPFMDTSG